MAGGARPLDGDVSVQAFLAVGAPASRSVGDLVAASRHQLAPVRRREVPGLHVSRNDSALLLKSADLAAAQRILEEKESRKGTSRSPLSLAYDTVPVAVSHVLVCRMVAANRRNAVASRLSAGDPAVVVVVVHRERVGIRG